MLDPWQEYTLRCGLGEKANGMWATPYVGVSVARQNGKGSIIEARELAGLLLFGERLIIHSAHEVKTALDGFRRVKHYFENYDDLSKRVKRIRETNGQESIEMMNGQMLRFMSRSKGSGRGFSSDCLILDEAQELPDSTWAAILPTLSARENPQAWLFGTPPTPEMHGDVFQRMRMNGLDNKPRLSWVEWSAPEGCDLDDPGAWAQGNPAMGIRITQDAIADERAAFDNETFARERLGMWDGPADASVVPADWWRNATDERSRAVDRLALGFDVSPDRSTGSVALAGLTASGKWHVELDETRSGVAWIPAYLEDICNHNDIRAVVVDGASPAASLIDELRQRKVRVTVTGGTEMAAACGLFYDAVKEDRLRHTGQPHMATALAAARKRPLMGGWAWNRLHAASDITPIVAATLALHGMYHTKAVKPVRKNTRRRVVVLR